MSRSVGLLGRDTDLRTFGNTAAAYALRAGSRMPAPNPVASHLPAPERELAGRASLLSRLRELLSEGSRTGVPTQPASRAPLRGSRASRTTSRLGRLPRLGH